MSLQCLADDIALAGALDGAGAAVFVDSKINYGHGDSLGWLSDNLHYTPIVLNIPFQTSV